MNKTLLAALLLLVTLPALAQETSNTTYIRDGVTFGTVLAIVTSWSRNKSVLWAILHGIFSWLYVIYFVLTRDNNKA